MVCGGIVCNMLCWNRVTEKTKKRPGLDKRQGRCIQKEGALFLDEKRAREGCYERDAKTKPRQVRLGARIGDQGENICGLCWYDAHIRSLVMYC